MGPGDLLRELDRRVLPPLARGLGRVGQGPARMRMVTGVALLSVTTVLLAAVWAADRSPAGEAAATSPDLIQVGVVEGQSVRGYVASSRGELDALLSSPAPAGAPATETYALVTLAAYVAPDRLTAVLGGVAVSEVYARAPLTGMSTPVVRLATYRLPDDVIVGLLDTAQSRDREQADYRRLSAEQVGDGENATRLRRVYDNAAQAAAAEAFAYRAGCSCVFAAVVSATPAALELIAARPEVRAVDPAPEVRRLDRAEFRPPLPEQLTGAPPAPSASPTPSATEPANGSRPAEHATTSPSSRPAPRPTPPSTPDIVTSASPGGPDGTSGPSAGAPGAPTAVPSDLPADPSTAAPS
jgi:hypothetical protein